MSSSTPPCSLLFTDDLEAIFEDDFGDDDFSFAQSPSKKNKKDDKTRLKCFSCAGKFKSKDSFSTGSLLTTGYIDDLLQSRLEGQPDRVSVFGVELNDSWLCCNRRIQHVFSIAQQKIHLIQASVQRSDKLQIFDVSGDKQTAQDVILLLSFLCNIIRNKRPNELDSIVAVIIHELHSLCRLLGPLPVFHSLPHTDSSFSVYFHLHLSVTLNITEIIHIIFTILPYHPSLQRKWLINTTADSEEDLFTQIIQKFILDLLPNAVHTFQRVSLSSCLSVSPWTCSCIAELLVILIHLLQHRQRAFAKPSFWLTVTPILEAVLQDNSMVDECDIGFNEVHIKKIPIKDRVSFSWWFLQCLVLLFNYDSYGNHSKSSQHAGNAFFVETLLKYTWLEREEFVRFHLRCFLVIYEHWDGHMQLMDSIWNHYARNLDKHFHVTNGLQGAQCINLTTSSLLQQVMSYTQEAPEEGHETSYDLFLRIVAAHFCKKNLTTANRALFKGHIYCKFHSRRIQEMSEIGMHRMTSLYLLLTQVSDLKDVSSRLCDLYGAILGSCQNVNIEAGVWRGIFVLIVFHIRQNSDVVHLCDSLKNSFVKICNEFCRSSSDFSRQGDLWSLLSAYFEGLTCVFNEASNLHLNEHKLLPVEFGRLFAHCRSNQLVRLLEFLKSLLIKIRNIVEANNDRLPGHLTGLLSMLWGDAYCFIKSHSCSLTPPAPQLASIAANYCRLASKQASLPESSVRLFLYLANNEDVNSNVSCLFLSEMLQDSITMATISRSSPLTKPLVSAWFKCAMTVSPDHPHLGELSRVIVKYIDLGVTLSYTSPATFLQSLSDHYRDINDFRGRMVFKQQMQPLFSDVHRHVQFTVEKRPSHEAMQVLYAFMGHMIKSCSSLIYVKSQSDCLLPRILQILVIRRKPLSPLMQTAFCTNGHMFLVGLSHLDFSHDPYLNRKIREIVALFLQANHSEGEHPLLLALSGSRSKEFRKFVLQILCEDYLTQQPVLAIIEQIVKTTVEIDQLAEDASVLLCPLVELIIRDGKSVNFIKFILEAANVQVENSSFIDQLQAQLSTLLMQHFPSHEVKVLRALEPVCRYSPHVMQRLIPMMSSAVKNCEHKRGVSVDKTLRGVYCTLLGYLGREGEEERAKFLSLQ